MRRLSSFAALCLLSGVVSGCAASGGVGDETGRKYVVFFTKGSSVVDQPGRDVIAHAAMVASRHPDLSLVVAGYAAAHGNLDADQALSAARADRVSASLQADGISASRISEHARPPANEDPGVAARRVEIGFVSSP